MDEFIIRVPDSGGFTMEVKEHEDIYYPWIVPGNPKEHFKAVRGLLARPDDVLLATYPKSGTHWLWEMLTMMHAGKVKPSPAPGVFIEMRKIEDAENLESPRMLVTHMRSGQLPVDFIKRKVKIIWLLRNPKDIAVSLHIFLTNLKEINYTGTWESFFPTFLGSKGMFGSWFDYVLDWEKFGREHPDYPMLTLYYEDLHKDCVGQLRKVAKFLDLDCGDAFLSAVSEECKFASMKAEKNVSRNDFVEEMSKDGTHPVYRKGIVGDWKNTFTVAQSEMMDSVYADKMKAATSSFTYTQ